MTEKSRAIRETQAYYKGVLEGLWRYAWMKDGVYYVGTTGQTLKAAQAQVELEMQAALKTLNDYV